jgi:D-sedoheptulose 7-phosphate isomerase
MTRGYFAALAALASGSGEALEEPVAKATALVAAAALAGRTTFAFGNGGSATQAQHFAAELVVRYKAERRGLPSIALVSDIAILTACTNDYDYSVVFSRQLEALGKPGDVALGITTSGKSPNVLRALGEAKRIGMPTIFLTGEKGRAEAQRWDVPIVVPEMETSHIQEIHLAVLHLICAGVDEAATR